MKNKTEKSYNVLIDTGATQSVVPSSVADRMEYEIGSRCKRTFVGANEKALKVEQYYINFEIRLENQKKYRLKNALILDINSDQILLGQYDMERLKAVVDCDEGTITLGRSKRAVFKMKRKTEGIKMVKGLDVQQQHFQEAVEQYQKSRPDNWSLEQTIAEPAECYQGGNGDEPDLSTLCKKCDKCTSEEKTEKKIFELPNSKYNLEKYLERERQRLKETTSYRDVTISPEGERRYPRVAKEVRRLNEKYKNVFSEAIGRVGKEYEVKIRMKGDKPKRQAGQTPIVGLEKLAMQKQLLTLAANGVIVPIEKHNVVPHTFVPLMVRTKKDDNGIQIDPFQALRIITDCTKINEMADYPGSGIDHIDEALQNAAKATENGLNVKYDIVQFYFGIPIHPSMYPFFCIDVPGFGYYHLEVLPQGFAPSAQYAVAVAKKILWKFNEVMERFMDDCFMWAPEGEDQFIHLYEQMLKTFDEHGLRLKGSKTFVLNFEANFVGHQISHGVMKPSPHLKLRIDKIRKEDIRTIGQMKSYLGTINFMIKYMKRSHLVLRPLQQASKGTNMKTLFQWTPELEHDFEKSKKALQELVQLHAFDFDLDTIMICDSSKHHSGGLIIQIKNGQKRLVACFSRSRKDAERVFDLSSCHAEFLALCAMAAQFEPWLAQMKKMITVITDSMSLVKLWRRIKKNQCPSTDTLLNNCVWQLRYLDLNIIHSSNKTENIKIADYISRFGINQTFEDQTCTISENMKKCRVCDAAAIPLSSVRMLNKAINRVSHSSALIEREGFWNRIDRIMALSPKKIVPINRLKKINMTFSQLLNNPQIIRELQQQDKVFRAIIDCIEAGRPNFPRKFAKATTINEKREPELVNGALKLAKYPKGIRTTVYPIPATAAYVIIYGAHKEVGHRAPSQLIKHINREFEVENLTKLVELFVQKCPSCTLLRAEKKYLAPKAKPVKLAKDFFQQILMDEVHRTTSQGSLKIMMAMEAISGFIIVIPIEGDMNGSKFVAMVAHAKAILTPHAADVVNIELRADKAPWHTSAQVRQDLEALKVNLQLYESSSLTKNIIPELDAKIKAFSPHFKYYAQMGSDAVLSSILAAQKLNTTVNEHGVTASELFTGRNPYRPNEPTPVATDYLDQIMKKRKEKRDSLERSRLKQAQKHERETIPYKDVTLNSPLSRKDIDWSMLKENDLIKLNQTEDKNDKKINLFEIVKVDYKNQKVQCVRADGTYPNPVRTINFDRIARHLPAKQGRINMLQIYLTDNTNEDLKKSTKGIVMGGPSVKGYIGNIGWQPEIRGLIEFDLEKYPDLPGLDEAQAIPPKEWNDRVQNDIQNITNISDIWYNESILEGLSQLFTEQFDESAEIVTQETLERAQNEQRARRIEQISDNTSILKSTIGSGSVLGRFIDSLIHNDREESIRIMNEDYNRTKNDESKKEESAVDISDERTRFWNDTTKINQTKKDESVIDLSGERTKFWNETELPDFGTPMKIEPEYHGPEPARRGSSSTPRIFQQAVRNMDKYGRKGSTSTPTGPRRSNRATTTRENAYIDGKNEINPS